MRPDFVPKGAKAITVVQTPAMSQAPQAVVQTAPPPVGGQQLGCGMLPPPSPETQALPQMTALVPQAQQKGFMSQEVPRGALAVALRGYTSSFMSGPAPAAAPSAPESTGGTTYTIQVEGLGSDGQKYVAEFDAVFPSGTKLLGAKQIQR